MYTLDDIRIIPLSNCSGGLVVAEATSLPLSVKRFFMVTGHDNEKRGKHAHRAVTQYLICVHGACDVICDDGKQKKKFSLVNKNEALLLLPGIWAEQTYLEPETILLVACDALYDEADYIRDYHDFLKYRLE